MTNKQKDFGILFWLHLLFILFTYVTPILFNYRLVIMGVGLLQLQYWLFGGCILTHAELGAQKYQSFYYHYLHWYFPNLKPKQVWLFSTYGLSILGITFALVLQLGFGMRPWII